MMTWDADNLQIGNNSRAAFGPGDDMIDVEIFAELAATHCALAVLFVVEESASVRIGVSAH
jgi:hypothetical protein